MARATSRRDFSRSTACRSSSTCFTMPTSFSTRRVISRIVSMARPNTSAARARPILVGGGTLILSPTLAFSNLKIGKSVGGEGKTYGGGGPTNRWPLISQNSQLAHTRKHIATAQVLTLSSSKGRAFHCFGGKENNPNDTTGRTAAFSPHRR